MGSARKRPISASPFAEIPDGDVGGDEDCIEADDLAARPFRRESKMCGNMPALRNPRR
jgi:hypothetical protein